MCVRVDRRPTIDVMRAERTGSAGDARLAGLASGRDSHRHRGRRGFGSVRGRTGFLLRWGWNHTDRDPETSLWELGRYAPFGEQAPPSPPFKKPDAP
jgi:hypothetical protein